MIQDPQTSAYAELSKELDRQTADNSINFPDQSVPVDLELPPEGQIPHDSSVETLSAVGDTARTSRIRSRHQRTDGDVPLAQTVIYSPESSDSDSGSDTKTSHDELGATQNQYVPMFFLV